MLTVLPAMAAVNRGFPLLLLAHAVAWTVAQLLPERTATLFRDVSIDPWRALWLTASLSIVVCLDTRDDEMERGLRRSLVLRRAGVLTLAIAGTGGAVALSAATTAHSTAELIGGLGGCAMVIALVVATTVVAGQAAGVTLGFFVILVNWVFGINDLTYEAEPWALLLRSPAPSLVALSSLGCVSAVGVWCAMGTRRTS